MRAEPALSVVIPAFNEAERLPATLCAVDDYLERAPIDAEVIVVNDGSVDDTSGVAHRAARHRENWRVLEGVVNRGKGHAVRRGMLEAAGRWRLFLDADNSTAPEQVDACLPWFDQGYDIVIGSRGIRGARLEPRQNAVKHWLGKTGNLVIQGAVLPGIWDTQCGFKCFSARAATAVFGRTRIDRWGFDIEALAIARRLGFRIREVPVRWVNDPRSGVGWKEYASTLGELARIRWSLWRGLYER